MSITQLPIIDLQELENPETRENFYKNYGLLLEKLVFISLGTIFLLVHVRNY